MRPTAIVLLALLAVGCGGPKPVTISGEITVDGQPLDKGVISFIPADGQGQPIVVEVVNGRYSANSFAGKFLVQISASKVVDRRREYNRPDAPMVDITEERLPEKYNVRTELSFEAQPGANTKDWKLDGVKN